MLSSFTVLPFASLMLWVLSLPLFGWPRTLTWISAQNKKNSLPFIMRVHVLFACIFACCPHTCLLISLPFTLFINLEVDHNQPVHTCAWRASHSQLLLFLHLHTNQLSGLLCIFRYICSGPYSASQIFPSSPEKLDRLKTWAIGRGEASPFIWIYGLNSIQTCPVSFVETNEIPLPWDKPILQMNCLSLPLNLSSATS